MNKRGQVFLIAAIIFSIAIYSVAIEYNTIKTYPGLEDYKELSENYQTEYPKVMNFAIYHEEDQVEAASDFTQAFLAQTEQTDPNFGVFYLYKDNEGNLHIVNTLNNKALKLEYTDPIAAEDVSLILLSADGPAEGDLCINGISCSTETAIVGDFDTAYFSTEVTAPSNLGISIVGEDGGASVDITSFTSMTYLRSEEQGDLPSGLENVGVSLIQY